MGHAGAAVILRKRTQYLMLIDVASGALQTTDAQFCSVYELEGLEPRVYSLQSREAIRRRRPLSTALCEHVDSCEISRDMDQVCNVRGGGDDERPWIWTGG